jgi:Protein of unknown function (DUF2628)
VKTYLVFEPPGGARTLEAAERVVFLREKFSWPALFLTPIWLLWSRLWLGFLGWVVLTAAIAGGMTALGLKEWAGFIAAAIPSLIAGFEATALKRHKLMRRGFREAAVMVADDRDSAERRFFAAWIADAGKAREETPPLSMAPAALPPSGVIGLFPEPGGVR